MINQLDIPSFIPRIQQYFGHFLPTVQELVLENPKGTHRQITYFIGLFRHLEGLAIHHGGDIKRDPVDDPTFIPIFVPPLRGRLVMSYLAEVGLLEDMIDRFRGLRFSSMALFNMEGTQLLLNACAETLKELDLYPTDPRGEEFFCQMCGF